MPTGGPRCLSRARVKDGLDVDALLAVAGVNLQRALAGDHQIVHAAHLDEARLLHHRLVLDRQAHNRRCCVAGEHRAVRSDDHLHVVHVGHGLPVARQVAVEERCARLRLHLAQHGDAFVGPLLPRVARRRSAQTLNSCRVQNTERDFG